MRPTARDKLLRGFGAVCAEDCAGPADYPLAATDGCSTSNGLET
jgi:hypothetical protein